MWKRCKICPHTRRKCDVEREFGLSKIISGWISSRPLLARPQPSSCLLKTSAKIKAAVKDHTTFILTAEKWINLVFSGSFLLPDVTLSETTSLFFFCWCCVSFRDGWMDGLDPISHGRCSWRWDAEYVWFWVCDALAEHLKLHKTHTVRKVVEMEIWFTLFLIGCVTELSLKDNKGTFFHHYHHYSI